MDDPLPRHRFYVSVFTEPLFVTQIIINKEKTSHDNTNYEIVWINYSKIAILHALTWDSLIDLFIIKKQKTNCKICTRISACYQMS